MNLFKNKQLAGIVCGALLISGCTATNPYTGEKQVSDTTIGAGVGTAGGAALGALVGGERGALIGGALGAITGGTIGHMMDNENEELRQALVGTGVQVHKVGNAIQLVMASDVTFDTNQYDVRSNFYPTLNAVATVFKKYDKNSITITGYTDNSGGDAYNQTLSEERARSVGDYLISQGVPANRIFTNGFGKRNPIASNATAAGRAMNRRVVITLRPIS
ncbi:MAG: glycine zipper 2TM domain-containing protein [Gammaproteobacteria bacterium]|nr:MAG: glycine zipper 2TM domain-containing protein [Gammaproteobacteria bacterium]